MGKEWYLLICGPGRSGTSLAETLIHTYVEDVYCFNELALSCKLDDLVSFCDDMKDKLLKGEMVPKRITRTGRRTTNTWRDGAEVVYELPDKEIKDNVIVAHKSILGCPYELDNILASNWFKVVVIVRNPIYTIAAWSDPKHRDMNVYRVMDNDLHAWWQTHEIDWVSDDPIERRAIIWEHEVSRFLEHQKHDLVKFIRYEDMVKSPEGIMYYLATWLNRSLVKIQDYKFDKIETCNKEARYPFVDFEHISQAVKKYCPSRKIFDYE